jgi:hypothetical protein
LILGTLQLAKLVGFLQVVWGSALRWWGTPKSKGGLTIRVGLIRYLPMGPCLICFQPIHMVGIQLIINMYYTDLYGVCSHSSFCRHIPMLDHFKLKLCFSEPMSCRQDRPVVLPNGEIGVRTTSQITFTGGCSITIVRLLGQLLKFAYEKKVVLTVLTIYGSGMNTENSTDSGGRYFRGQLGSILCKVDYNRRVCVCREPEIGRPSSFEFAPSISSCWDNPLI